MPVFRWGQNWDPFRDLEREVDRLLQGMNMSLQGRSNRRFPLINLRDLGAEFLLTAEIPGVDSGSIEVTVSGGVLTIRGTRESPPEAREDTFRRQERFQGAWQRSVQLPDRIDEAEMKADYTAGILRITLPRSQDTISRTIPVTEGPAS
ncbi:MAG TPA: heat-shock protein Hsp20 [Planctomycetaceae bacterium]|nr:heat-shock protein Hsp20 [Planctomycetaceae bacterium]